MNQQEKDLAKLADAWPERHIGINARCEAFGNLPDRNPHE